MRETFKDKLVRQIGLEDESRALGASRYRARRPLPWRHEPSSTDEEGDLPPGRQLLRLAIHPTAQQAADIAFNNYKAHHARAYSRHRRDKLESLRADDEQSSGLFRQLWALIRGRA